MREIEDEIIENLLKIPSENQKGNLKETVLNEELKKIDIKKQQKTQNASNSLDNNFNSTFQSLISLSDENRLKIFENLKNKKENPFDFFLLYSDYKRNSLSGNKIHPIVLGGNYIMIKSMLRKKLMTNQNLNENDKNDNESYISLDDMSKLSLKERLSYKNYQKDMNSKHNIYEDIKEYIRNEINSQYEFEKLKNLSANSLESNINSSIDIKKVETEVDEIFEKIVIQDLNDMIINNILNNKKIYLALVIVRNERLTNLYDKLKEYKIKI